MTVTERIAELAGEIRTVLVHYGAGHEDGLILDLAELMSGIIAREVEKACRPDDRWRPKQQRGRKAS